MPVSTYWESEGFVFKASGIVSSKDIMDSMEAFEKLPPSIHTKYQIVNALDAEDIVMSDEEIVNLATEDLEISRKHPHMSVALIAKEGPVMENFIKYLKISWSMNTSWDIRIFNTEKAARNWLSQVAV